MPEEMAIKEIALVLSERDCLLLYGSMASGGEDGLRKILGDNYFTQQEAILLKQKLLGHMEFRTKRYVDDLEKSCHARIKEI